MKKMSIGDVIGLSAALIWSAVMFWHMSNVDKKVDAAAESSKSIELRLNREGTPLEVIDALRLDVNQLAEKSEELERRADLQMKFNGSQLENNSTLSKSWRDLAARVKKLETKEPTP